ncbi:MAG TPA: radical SAM protein [Candidatus Omnitrophota bacterium]|nr:radical SAM protein [Candidatus Omnitrophota bacterium]HRY85119.1 radical SAM protein [Candidatus Omnitrophota bacterium]
MQIRENPITSELGRASGASFEAQGEGPAGTCSHKYKRLCLYLIKPSKYDDEGYLIRYWKGVLPSNTLSCLNGLSEDVREREVLGKDLAWDITLIDDTVQKIPYRKIARKDRQAGTKTVICLVGVQSNQFPRASDIAIKFRKAGIDVLIGGFHVSGIMATLPDLSPELVTLKNAGVILVAGEAEGGHWERLLRDAMQGRLRPVYNFLNDIPDISKAPFPRINPKHQKHYALEHFGTLDCGRGCPFGCSFCTVINVQGRKMRFRDVDLLIQRIREDYRRHNISHYFFTDDNFCRHKNWETILDRLIELKEKEGIPFHFMMQLDTQAHTVPNFVEKAARAGCRQVFIGIESLNQENLKAAKKNQNDIENFKKLVDSFHEVDVVCHLAYIIGFPLDTAESVRQDVEKLMSFGAGQASFFMMTPLPGSMDYKNALEKGMLLDADLNNYDTFHETHRHPRMKPGEWLAAYEAAWQTFYSTENMRRILARDLKGDNYWGIFSNFMWYKNSIDVEGGHPMICGFFRLKGRLERRSGYPIEDRWTYFKRRCSDILRAMRGRWKLALELEEVWLATRRRGPLEQKVIAEIARLTQCAKEWRDLRVSELQNLYRKAAASLEKKGVYRFRTPSGFRLWLDKWNIFSLRLTFTRAPLQHFWENVGSAWKRGNIWGINYIRLFFATVEESVLFVRFLLSILISGIFLRKH